MYIKRQERFSVMKPTAVTLLRLHIFNYTKKQTHNIKNLSDEERIYNTHYLLELKRNRPVDKNFSFGQ